MAKEGVDLFNTYQELTDLATVIAALQKLKQDFDAHNHDGVNSKSFDNITARSLLASGQIVGSSIYIPSINNPKFIIDLNGNAKVSSLERRDFDWFTLFESIDGFGTAGTVAISNNGVSVTTGAVSGNAAEFQKIATQFSGDFTWNRNRKFRCGIKFSQNTSQHIYVTMGPAQSAAPTSRHFGFQVIDGDLYGVVANGTSRTVTGVLVSFSAGQVYSLEAKFFVAAPNSAARVEYYVNGNLLATLTDTLPTGTTNANFLEEVYVITDTNAARDVEVSYWHTWQASPA